jgi:hypothetical protein
VEETSLLEEAPASGVMMGGCVFGGVASAIDDRLGKFRQIVPTPMLNWEAISSIPHFEPAAV